MDNTEKKHKYMFYPTTGSKKLELNEHILPSGKHCVEVLVKFELYQRLF